MRRRNLIVTSDSESDDGGGGDAGDVSTGSGHNVQTPNPSAPQIQNPNRCPFPLPSSPPPSPPIEISDDEDPDGDAVFVDVADHFSPPAPPPPPPTAAAAAAAALASARTPTAVSEGRLRPVDEFLRRLGLWLRPEWLESCAAGIPGFAGLGEAMQARRCFEQFLFADMNACGAGVLPEGVGGMHAAVLDGPFVLQVDEIVNISASLRERYHDASAGPKRCLKLSMTDGMQRIFGMEYRPIKDLEVLAPAGFKIVIRNVHVRRGLLMLVPEVIELLGGAVDDLEAARERLVSEVNKPPRGKRKQGGLPLSRRATLAAWACNISTPDGGEAGILMPGNVNPSNPTGPANASQNGATAQTTIEESVNPPVGVSNHPSLVVNNVQEQGSHDIQEITMEELAASVTRNRREEPVRLDSPHRISSTGNNDTDVAQFSKVDGVSDQTEDTLILSGENEKPFTYLYSMMADWHIQRDTKLSVQGKIKCFLTGVLGFQFRRCSEYKLRVYIEDGSHISEVIIDHNVVQNQIGYSLEEVIAALDSSDAQTVLDMRETLGRFQLFLSKFEGTVLLEFNRSSSVPIVREMNQGCSSSDAWLLLRRLKMLTARRYLHNHPDSMDTTP